MEHPIQATRPVYDLGRWFEQAWNVFKAHIWEFILLAVVIAIPAMVIGGMFGGFSAIDAWQHPQRPSSPFPLVPSRMTVVLTVVAAIFGAVVTTPLAVGAAAVSLNVVRTSVFDWDRLWTGFRKWPDCFVIGLIVGALILPPSLFPLLWILFPLWIAIGLWGLFAYYILSEPGADFRAAINGGIRLIKGNFWWGVLFAFVSGFVSALGVIACCIGVFVTAAFYQALIATAYNDLTRQMAAPTSSEGEAAP